VNWPRTRLLRSGTLIALGLLVEAATFFFGGPVPFLVFALVGCVLALAGVADFLHYVLAGPGPAPDRN
jgi:hypothetical protein